MPNIYEIAASAGIDWRTLTKIAPGLAPGVADAICTRRRFRTPSQQAAIDAAQQIGDSTDDTSARKKRRMEGVNQASSRVNGRYVRRGQPRGQKRNS